MILVIPNLNVALMTDQLSFGTIQHIILGEMFENL